MDMLLELRRVRGQPSIAARRCWTCSSSAPSAAWSALSRSRRRIFSARCSRSRWTAPSSRPSPRAACRRRQKSDSNWARPSSRMAPVKATSLRCHRQAIEAKGDRQEGKEHDQYRKRCVASAHGFLALAHCSRHPERPRRRERVATAESNNSRPPLTTDLPQEIRPSSENPAGWPGKAVLALQIVEREAPNAQSPARHGPRRGRDAGSGATSANGQHRQSGIVLHRAQRQRFYSSDPSAQIAPGEDAPTMQGTTRPMPQSRKDHGCGSERVEMPVLTN